MWLNVPECGNMEMVKQVLGEEEEKSQAEKLVRTLEATELFREREGVRGNLTGRRPPPPVCSGVGYRRAPIP